MEKLILSGAAGFLGSNLLEACLMRNFEVIGIDDFSNGNLTNIANFLKDKKFYFIKRDVRVISPNELSQEKIKAIYHLAANLSSNYESYIENVQITKKMLEIARKKDAEIFVFVSSTKAIGLITSKKPIDESFSCIPSDWYGKSKLECENLVRNFCETYGIKYYIFRPPRIFGPRDWQKTFVDLSRFISRANAVPISPIKINVVYVKNLVEALCLVLNRSRKSCTYIVSDGAFSISKISLTIAKLLGKKKIKKIKVPKHVFTLYSLFTGAFTHARRGIIYSSRKFREEFNFKPPYTFYQAMKETLKYFALIK